MPLARTAAAGPVTAFPRPASTRPVDLRVLAAATGGDVVASSEQVGVGGVTLRAAEVRPGDLFAALPGARVHGADFVADALSAGAAAVLTDPAGLRRVRVGAGPGEAVQVLVHPAPRDVVGVAAATVYGDPTRLLRVLGVTGTSGKTTVAHLVEAGLAAGGRATGLLGTVRTRIGGTSLPSAFTTPEAPDLQALFAVMIESGVTDVAMEVSSHALALGRVVGTRFAVGAFTNLSQDHLDFHVDMEDYFAAKASLFADGRTEHAVICVDDAWGVRLAARTPGAVTVATRGGEGLGSIAARERSGRAREPTSLRGDAAAWSAGEVTTRPDGTQAFTARTPHGPLPVHLQLPGSFNIANALVALASLDAVGVPPALAAEGIARVAVPGRMQRVERGQPFLAVVDYAHKPAAVAALLDALRAQVPGRLLVVLGAGGDRDRTKRPLMGAAAAARADVLVVTDDNPRGEDAAAIRAAVLAGARDEPHRGVLLEVGDRAEAIAAAVERARAGDAVVVAGKGHETGQKVGEEVLPFDDAEELARAISAAVPG